MSFDKKDVIAIAEALLDPDACYDYYGGDYDENGYTCNHCCKFQNEDRIKAVGKSSIHELDCPVLIAQDILTRS